MDRDRANDPVGAWRAFWSTLADAGDLVTPDNVRYLSGYWRLAPYEALVVDFVDDGTADYWNLVIMSIWEETVDWRERPTSVNRANAVRRADGRVRVVVAHADPGVPNWLDTACHPEGSIALRWFFATAPLPEADIRVVPLDQVAALPWSSVPRAGGKGCGLHTFKCVYRGSRPDTEDLFGDAGEAQEPEIGTTGGRQLDSYREPVIGESGG